MSRRIDFSLLSLLLAGLMLTACSNSSDDDDGEGTGDVEISGNDVSGLTESMDAVYEVAFSGMSFVPLDDTVPSHEGDDDGHFDGDCVTYDPPEPEIDNDGNFDFTVYLNNCEHIDEDDETTTTVSGVFTMSGSTSPDGELVSDMISSCSVHIEGLEDILTDKGEIVYLLATEADYEYVAGDFSAEVSDVSNNLLLYDEAVLLACFATYPFETADGVDLEAHFAMHIVSTFDVDDPESEPTFEGTLIVELTRTGKENVLQSVTFNFDGTAVVQFEVEPQGTSGTVDLVTGDVQVD